MGETERGRDGGETLTLSVSIHRAFHFYVTCFPNPTFPFPSFPWNFLWLYQLQVFLIQLFLLRFVACDKIKLAPEEL